MIYIWLLTEHVQSNKIASHAAAVYLCCVGAKNAKQEVSIDDLKKHCCHKSAYSNASVVYLQYQNYKSFISMVGAPQGMPRDPSDDSDDD